MKYFEKLGLIMFIGGTIGLHSTTLITPTIIGGALMVIGGLLFVMGD